MDRDLLSHLPVILAVARRGGFAAAAAELGTSPSTVSHSVRLVEDRIGAPLFARTTRAVALTEAGRSFVTAIAPALEEIAEAGERLRAAQGAVTGTLRLNAPSMAVPLAVVPILRLLAERHPALTVEVTSDDALTDIVAEGFDAGIRLGQMIAQDMIAVRLTGELHTALVASPGYVERHGMPARIADLRAHNCITYRKISSRSLYKWELGDGEAEIEFETQGTVIVNDWHHAMALAEQGVGIAYTYRVLVTEAIAAGRLVEILPETSVSDPGLFLYYPRRASLAPKLRAFIDAARAVAAERAADEALRAGSAA